MTTKVTVDAHAGWPVEVLRVNSSTGNTESSEIVPANDERTTYVWQGVHLVIRELPKEPAA